MVDKCPLFIRPAFIGRTYHDFQLKFQTSLTNCTVDTEQNPLLIQFTRILNSTYNITSYSLYDPTRPENGLPRLQVFEDDHVNLCLRSALDTNTNAAICHEFYMITMLSSMNTTIWPLLIIFAYIMVLLIAMLFSFLSHALSKLSQTLFSGSITKKIINNRNMRIFLPLSSQRDPAQQTNRIKKMNEKKEVIKAIELIAKDCRVNTQKNTFSIQTNNTMGHTNQGYV